MTTQYADALVEAQKLFTASGIEGAVYPNGTRVILGHSSDHASTVLLEQEKSRSDGTTRMVVKVQVEQAGARIERSTFDAMKFNVRHNQVLKLAIAIESKFAGLEFKA